MNYRVHWLARREVDRIVDLYDAIRPGLGGRVATAYIRRRQQILLNPRAFSLAPATPAGREVRQVLVPKFPYKIVYEAMALEVVILSVTHAHRKSQPWRRRRP